MRCACLLIILTWAALSSQSAAPAAEAAAEMSVQRDIAYAEHPGSDKRLTSLDVYSPASGEKHPIMVWIHGGGWRRGDKANVSLKPRAFVGQGYVLVSVNYRLVPQVTYKEQGGDVAQAIRWVHDHAQEHRGAADRIVVMGHSAGAHLAALVATDDRYLKAQELPLNTIKGAILLDGAGYNIPDRIEAAPPAARRLAEGVFGSDKKTQKDASPITHVAQDKGIPPFLIIHVADRAESKAQSHELANALRKAGVSAEVVPAEGKSHGSLNQELGQPDDKPTAAVFAFLSRLK